jgi:protein TonB
VKLDPENRSLAVAIGISVALHALLLAVRIVAPDSFRMEPVDPGLEVILVNAKHARKPLKAEALAQADLDGGGNADAGRSKSPLPDMRRNDMGESIKAMQRKIAEYEQLQSNLVTRVNKSDFNVKPLTEKDKPDPNRTGADALDSAKAIARTAAEITQRIEDENKRPRKTFITPSTRKVGYAEYYNTMAKRIEDIGTLNFPQKGGKKLYGELIMQIPVFQDGSIYERDGGIKVSKSSGNADLDKAAINIVKRSAPFGKFPPRMLSADRDDLWVILITFKFSQRDGAETSTFGEKE